MEARRFRIGKSVSRNCWRNQKNSFNEHGHYPNKPFISSSFNALKKKVVQEHAVMVMSVVLKSTN